MDCRVCPEPKAARGEQGQAEDQMSQARLAALSEAAADLHHRIATHRDYLNRLATRNDVPATSVESSQGVLSLAAEAGSRAGGR